jgi:penicillin-binding protein 1A
MASLFRIGCLGLLVVGAALAWGLHQLWPRCTGSECPSVESLRDYTPPQASRIFDREGRLLAHLAPERRIVVPLERIPVLVQDAFLAIEDKRFYQHPGVDPWRVGGAVRRNVRARRWEEGFSTITMQLARNVFPGHLGREKTLRRKVWEVVLAAQIEARFEKREILEMYLNQIYLGEGFYGVEAAAQGYFGKTARDLSPAEAALLAALPKAPSYYNPHRSPEAAKARRDVVLRLMARQGRIAESAAEEARRRPLELRPPREARGLAPYFVAAVRAELRERLGPESETAGLRVHTWLDLDVQRAAEEEIASQLAAIERGEFGRFPTRGCTEETPERCLQAMLIALEVESGGVLALVGGRSFRQSQYDRALQAQRQPGSAFKTVLYAAAIAQGVPLSTPLTGPNAAEYEGEYRPADHVEEGTAMNLREGFRTSSNRAAVALGERTGVDRVVQMGRALGLSTRIPAFPSTFLGAAEVVPAELVAATATLAAGGVRVRHRMIRRIEDADGNVLYEAEPPRERAVSPEVAYLGTELLREVVARGTGTAARQAGIPAEVPVGGKTGTTNEATDVWFVGATPDVAAGVWFGFDQPRRIMVGASGGRLAAPVFGRVVGAYYQHHAGSGRTWERPEGVVLRTVDRGTGMLATSDCPEEDRVSELFILGMEPEDHCPLHAAGIPQDGFSDEPPTDWIEGRLMERDSVR